MNAYPVKPKKVEYKFLYWDDLDYWQAKNNPTKKTEEDNNFNDETTKED